MPTPDQRRQLALENGYALAAEAFLRQREAPEALALLAVAAMDAAIAGDRAALGAEQLVLERLRRYARGSDRAEGALSALDACCWAGSQLLELERAEPDDEG